ncbi:HAMP domain-containing protein [bacterium]|nr:HAMP domain-containing protein [bacterium]
MKRSGLSFVQKLFLTFVMIALVPLSVFYFSLNFSLNRLNELSREHMHEKGAQLHAELDGLAREIERVIELIKRSQDIQKMQRALAAQSFTQSEHLATANQFMLQAGLDFLDICDQNGIIRSSGHWPMAWDSVEDSDLWWVRHYPDQPVYRWEQYKGLQAVSLQVTSTTEPIQGQFLIISGGYRLDRQQLIDRLAQKTGSLVFLFTPHNQNLIAAEHGFNLSAGDLEQIKQVGTLSNQKTGSGCHYHMTLHELNYDLECFPFWLGPLTEQPQIELLGLLGIGLSQDSLQAPQQTLKKAILPLVLLTLIVSLLLSIFFSRRITRPVNALVTGTLEVSSGNLDHRIPVMSTDEIGLLVESFNTMTTQLNESKKQLIQAERIATWQEIARRLAHELKNPLSPIQLSIETLQKTYQIKHPEFDEIFQESTQAILEEVNQLKKIVDEFALFARMPAPRKVRTNLNQIIINTLKLYTGLPDHINLHTTLDHDLPDSPIDPDMFSQVIKNLLGNAIEALGQGGTISIETAQRQTERGNSILLIVHDTGKGISEKEMANMFIPYFTTKKGGTGLGLPIVHRIVSDHGGIIKVNSASDQGTTITIEITMH